MCCAVPLWRLALSGFRVEVLSSALESTLLHSAFGSFVAFGSLVELRVAGGMPVGSAGSSAETPPRLPRRRPSSQITDDDEMVAVEEVEEVRVHRDRPVVEGGSLKKPWVPEPLLGSNGAPVQAYGNYFLSLSGNDYLLGQFLFGKANGKHGRNLPRLRIVRALWKARNAAQDEALSRTCNLHGRAAANADRDILGAIFDEPDSGGGDPEGAPRGTATVRRLRSMRKNLLAELPPSLEVSIPSAQEGVSQITFTVATTKSECMPAIALTSASLKALRQECRAEAAQGFEEDNNEEPGTPPPRRNRGRRVAPSPGTSPKKKKKKKKQHVRVSHDKRLKRIVACWRKVDGTWGREIWKLESPGDAVEVARLLSDAKSYARRRHVVEEDGQ